MLGLNTILLLQAVRLNHTLNKESLAATLCGDGATDMTPQRLHAEALRLIFRHNWNHPTKESKTRRDEHARAWKRKRELDAQQEADVKKANAVKAAKKEELRLKQVEKRRRRDLQREKEKQEMEAKARRAEEREAEAASVVARQQRQIEENAHKQEELQAELQAQIQNTQSLTRQNQKAAEKRMQNSATCKRKREENEGDTRDVMARSVQSYHQAWGIPEGIAAPQGQDYKGALSFPTTTMRVVKNRSLLVWTEAAATLFDRRSMQEGRDLAFADWVTPDNAMTIVPKIMATLFSPGVLSNVLGMAPSVNTYPLYKYHGIENLVSRGLATTVAPPVERVVALTSVAPIAAINDAPPPMLAFPASRRALEGASSSTDEVVHPLRARIASEGENNNNNNELRSQQTEVVGVVVPSDLVEEID